MQTTYHLIAHTSPRMGFSSLSIQTRSSLPCGSEASLYAKPFVYVGCTTHLPQVKTLFSTMAHVQLHFALLWFGINSSQMEKTENTLMKVSKYFPTHVL